MHTLTEDLSKQSQLISDLFKWPETKHEWEKYKLSKEQLEFFDHHPLMVHGSFANKSPKSRHASVLNIFADGTESNTDEVLLTGVPPIKKSHKMDGQFFPLIFTPA